MSSTATLFAVTSKAVNDRTDLRALSPRVRRRMARHSAKTIAGWWPEAYTPEYVAEHTDQVKAEASDKLEKELTVGFLGIVPLLVSTLISVVARWIIDYVVKWLFSSKTTAYQAIRQYKVTGDAGSDAD